MVMASLLNFNKLVMLSLSISLTILSNCNPLPTSQPIALVSTLPAQTPSAPATPVGLASPTFTSQPTTLAVTPTVAPSPTPTVLPTKTIHPDVISGYIPNPYMGWQDTQRTGKRFAETVGYRRFNWNELNPAEGV